MYQAPRLRRPFREASDKDLQAIANRLSKVVNPVDFTVTSPWLVTCSPIFGGSLSKLSKSTLKKRGWVRMLQVCLKHRCVQYSGLSDSIFSQESHPVSDVAFWGSTDESCSWWMVIYAWFETGSPVVPVKNNQETQGDGMLRHSLLLPWTALFVYCKPFEKLTWLVRQLLRLSIDIMLQNVSTGVKVDGATTKRVV